MSLGLFEDRDLYQLAAKIVTEDIRGVNNAQISGLLVTIRSSGSHNKLRRMAEHQLEKARKDGDRGANKAAFYDRLLKELRQLAHHAEELLGPMKGEVSQEKKVARRNEKEQLSTRLASTLMTHIAAEHRWQGRRR